MPDQVHILLIEDEAAHAALIQRAFKRRAPDTKLSVATTLAEAQAFLQETVPDLIICDWHLPDGEAITLLKEGDALAPIVILASHGNEAKAVATMKAGAVDYVVKSTDTMQELPYLVERAQHEWRLLCEQRQAQTTLRDSEACMAAILDASLDCIITIDEQGQVVNFNPAAEYTFGYQAEDSIGQPIEDLIVPPRMREAHNNGMARYRVTRQSNFLKRRVKMSAMRADGSEFPIEMVVQPIELKGRTLFTAYLRDITDRNAFEKALIEAKENAEEVSRLKSTFLNNISHEIRTPLTAIIGFSSILNAEVTEDQREMIQLIEHSGKRLLNTLNSVLDLSMLEAGTLNLEREWFNLEEVVAEKIQMFRPDAVAKGVRVEQDCAIPGAEVYLVRTCMGRILDHLLDNAIKFTEAGSICVGIKLEDEALVLSVEDTGVGIEETFQPYLYEDFRQGSTGNTRSHEGTGLGLAITKRMAELMGGRISVHSEKAKGSVFDVRFPVSLLRLPGEHASSAQEGSTASGQLPRILAVEDSAVIDVLLSYILQENYSVDVARSEQEAMVKVQGPPYDLVLMDINLGDQRTGVDVMQDLRCIPAYANVPIVAMTAYALLEDRDRFMEAGFDGYLSKPFTTKELLTLIEQMLAMGVRRKASMLPVGKMRGEFET